MSDRLDLPELPFPVVASHAGVWRRDGRSGAVVADAPGHTDFYVNPGGEHSQDAESLDNAATLLGTPPDGDFQLSARVSVDFRAQYDAGVLMAWVDKVTWAKFCFEFSPAGEPMVVSVVTRGTSDDANAFTVPVRSVWLRISRIGRVYAFHASTADRADGERADGERADGKRVWQLIRVFTLGDGLDRHRVGLEVQAPTGDGCTVTFDEIHYVQDSLADLRDGS